MISETGEIVDEVFSAIVQGRHAMVAEKGQSIHDTYLHELSAALASELALILITLTENVPRG